MSSRSDSKRQNCQSMADDNTVPAKRSRKSSIFVEYQPAGTPKDTVVKRPVPAKQKSNGTSSRYLSCGECRRLKLKCDRVFPCQSCVKRGCEGICPTGSLVSGKGTRYVLASTEQLHEKISLMGGRIRELEIALQDVYEEHFKCLVRSYPDGLATDTDKSSTSPAHPLLQGDKLLIKNQLELYGEEHGAYLVRPPRGSRQRLEQTNATPSDRRTGRHGEVRPLSEAVERDTNGSPAPTLVNSAESTTPPIKQSLVPPCLIAPSSIISKLNSSFLAVWTKIARRERCGAEIACVQPGDSILKLARMQILEMLPAREEAERLYNMTQEVGFFILNYMLTDSEFIDIIQDVYDKRRANVSMNKAALLFILLGIGLRVDCFESKSSEDTNTMTDERVENYIDISRAAMTLQAVETERMILEEPELRIMQYHYLLMQYLVLFSMRKQDRQQTKDVMNIVVLLAKTAELQVESSYSKYSTAEQNERRILFYDILSTAGELSLALDQPMPFSSAEICHPPLCSRNTSTRHFSTQVEASYYECKYAFYVDCFKPLLDMRSAAPSSFLYSDVLELDCKIRTYPFPPMVLQDFDIKLDNTPGVTPTPLKIKLLRFITTYRTNSLLLHLHRKFLQQCLSFKNSVLAHPYFASLIATSRSAWLLIRNCDSMYREYPELMSRLAVPWYNIFCAASALFILVERIPYCPLAPYSLRELLRASELFDRATATHSPMAERAAPVVRQFVAKGTETLRRWKDTLASEFVKDALAYIRADYCTARFDAIISRIKRVKSSGPPLSTTLGTGCTNDPVEDGLEIWDIVHPEIGELLAKLPGCVIDRDTSEKLLLETVYTSLHDQGDRIPESSNPRTPLMDFFSVLDHQLRRCPEFVASSDGNAERSSPEPSLDAAAALRGMFPDDLDLDWAALTDALVAAPAELMSTVPGSNWSGQWEWRGATFNSDRLYAGVSWNGLADSSSLRPGAPWSA